MKSKFFYFLLFFFPMLIMSAQEGGIKGTVISSEDGMPLPGATVLISGTNTSTSTDFDGHFSFQQINPDATIVVSFVGFTPQSISVKGQKTFNITLKLDSNKLNEVVVTGYSKQKKTDITGAVAVVNMKEVMKQPEPNPIKALQGRVAGVKVSSDGSPSGGNTKVVIRGAGTFENTDPLYVIDGMPTKSGMHELNPNDIETIQVLKDASSASIYGSRASNGVIIITTKKGKAGKMRINFSTYSSFSDYSRKLDVMNANQFGQALWQANINDGLNPNNNNLSYQFDWSVNNNKPQLNKVLVPEYLDAEQTLKASNTDWYDEISQTGIANSYDLSVSNASDKGNYVFSLGYYGNEGVVKETNFERISARMNGSYKYFDGKLVIGENFSFNRTNEVTDPGVLDPALRALPIIPVHTVDGKGWGGPPVGGMNDRQNPVRLLEYNKDNNYDYLRLFGNMYADLEIIKNLHIKSSFGIDYGFYKKRTLQRSYQSGRLNNDQTSVTIDESVSDKWTWSNTAIYSLNFGKSNLNLLAGTEMNKDTFENTTLRKNDFLIETPDYMYPDAGTGESFTSGTSTGYSLLSYFGKVDYEFDNRYLLSATIRRDGSSRFGKNNKYGTFPAVSAGWRISNENFIKDNMSVISDLKLRAGWGQTGNQEISNTAIYSLYIADYAGGSPTWATSFGTAYDFSGNGKGVLPSGFRATQTVNNDLKWETTTQTNIGLDFGLFKQKLSGSVDYYKKKATDILVLPGFLAVKAEGGNRWVNGASMENEGWEVTLGYQDETSFGLKYDISGNISANKNKITHLPDEVKNNYGGDGLNDNILGRPINSMYGYVTDGLFKNQDEVDNSAIQEGKGLGRIRYKDLNGDGTITDKDRTWIGNPNPGLTYGFNLGLGYKNWDFTTFWEGASDVDVINKTKYQTDFWSVDDVGSNKGTRLLNAWSLDNPNSTIPALTTVDKNGESRFSTYYVENGNYLKLRVLQFGYSLPKELLKKINFESFRFYISGQNLLIIDAKSFTGVDPENAGFGYPQPTTFTAGLNFTL